MNKIYRLKRSRHDGMLVPVAECSRTRSKGGRSAVVAATLIIGSGGHGVAHGADIRVHSGNTQVYEAPNGVQVIDIATTNGAGVSHNRFTSYNVDPRGLVLNNNSPHTQAGPLQSQLAGQVVPNVNLAAEARLILNEVVAANRSELRGYTEVVGRKADVVVANPWGITCSGCGFINTDRVTLTTGVPTFGTGGSLDGFRVNQGDILVQGNGLDARTQSILDLVARSVKLDGQLNGQDVQVIAGNNDYAYTSRTASPLAVSGGTPLYAIDSTALGGMYANRIRLIATEAGVGVRMQGEAAATADDFILTAAGRIEMRGKASAERDIAITYTGDASGGSTALALSGSNAELAARRNVTLSAQNGAGVTFTEGKITAGTDLDISAGSLSDSASAGATRFAGNNLTLTTSGAADIDGSTWGAGNRQSMVVASLSVGGLGATFYSGSEEGAGDRDLALTASSGDLALGNASITSQTHLTLTADQAVQTGAGASLQAGGNASLSAAAVDHAGQLLAGGRMELTATASGSSLTNAGRLQSGETMTIHSASGTFGNTASGVVLSNTDIDLNAAALDNQGRIVAAGGIDATLGSLNNGNAGNSSALILGATGSGASSLTVGGSLDNYGAIHSNDDLAIEAAGITNRSTAGISSLTTLALEATGAGNIDNYGALYAGNALELTAVGNSITNRSGTGTIDSSGSVTTNSAAFINNNTVVADGDITITTTSSFVNRTAVSVSKQLGSVFDVRNHNAWQIANEGSFDNGMNAWVNEDEYSRREQLAGISEDALAALTKAQIIATGAGSSLTINYGSNGLNEIAVLSAPTVNISGSGTFTNQDMSLHQFEYRWRWIGIADESSGDDDFAAWARIDPSREGWNGDPDDDDYNWDNWNPGAGWQWVGHHSGGSFPEWLRVAAKDAAVAGGVRIGASVVRRFGAGIFAGTFNFNGGTLNNVSSVYPDNPAQAKVGSAQSASVTTQSPGSGVSASGINLGLPSNPNGYFVVARDPSARYLIETNPLFAVGANFVGSNYLAERYGYNPDDIQRRLGDANYEAYLIRQQLIEQSGSNLLKGYGDEATQMQRLMDQAIAQAGGLGLEWGKPLTSAQIAGLTEDIVWMEEVVVDGQRVLAPRVYLAPTTIAGLLDGAVIAADEVNIAGDALNNTGGTIEGGSTLTVTTTGDITNTSGSIKGGDVSLTSTEGSIKNETTAEGAGVLTRTENYPVFAGSAR